MALSVSVHFSNDLCAVGQPGKGDVGPNEKRFLLIRRMSK